MTQLAPSNRTMKVFGPIEEHVLFYILCRDALPGCPRGHNRRVLLHKCYKYSEVVDVMNRNQCVTCARQNILSRNINLSAAAATHALWWHSVGFREDLKHVSGISLVGFFHLLLLSSLYISPVGKSPPSQTVTWKTLHLFDEYIYHPSPPARSVTGLANPHQMGLNREQKCSIAAHQPPSSSACFRDEAIGKKLQE